MVSDQFNLKSVPLSYQKSIRAILLHAATTKRNYLVMIACGLWRLGKVLVKLGMAYLLLTSL